MAPGLGRGKALPEARMRSNDGADCAIAKPPADLSKCRMKTELVADDCNESLSGHFALEFVDALQGLRQWLFDKQMTAGSRRLERRIDMKRGWSRHNHSGHAA